MFNSIISALTDKPCACAYCGLHEQIKLSSKPKVIFCSVEFDGDGFARPELAFTQDIKYIISVYARIDKIIRQYSLFKHLHEPTYVLLNSKKQCILAQTGPNGVLIFPQDVDRHRAGLTVATDMLITLLHEYYHVIYPAVNKHSDERADLFATECAERIIGYALLDMDLIERVRSNARARLV